MHGGNPHISRVVGDVDPYRIPLHSSLFYPSARSSVIQKRDLREPSPMEKVPRNEADEAEEV